MIEIDLDKVVRLPVRKRPNERQLERVPYEPGKCEHLNVTFFYSEAENEVTCGACGAKLNPIWVIAQLGNQECRWLEARRRYIEAKAEHEKRRRCKCQHCGQMTNIRGM